LFDKRVAAESDFLTRWLLTSHLPEGSKQTNTAHTEARTILAGDQGPLAFTECFNGILLLK
jgi:hypothetical protein